jgi:hypothetical protein
MDINVHKKLVFKKVSKKNDIIPNNAVRTGVFRTLRQ